MLSQLNQLSDTSLWDLKRHANEQLASHQDVLRWVYDAIDAEQKRRSEASASIAPGTVPYESVE